MTTIPLDLIHSTWKRFSSEPGQQHRRLLTRFSIGQSVLHKYVSEQDKEWFSGQPPRICPLSVFIWLVFVSALKREPPPVSEATLINLLNRRVEAADFMDAECEYKANEMARTALMKHPQLELSLFVLQLLAGREDNPELTPNNIKAAHMHLDVVIHALDYTAGV